MHIILDTSIIFDNYFFDTPKFLGLFDYLKKTHSKLYLPSFVIDEILKKYKENLSKYKDSLERDERILFGQTKEINIDDLVLEYASKLTNLIKKNNIGIIKPKDISSKKLFGRAIKIEPPFDASGRGLRDTLIWLSIVDFVKNDSTGYFCFISANIKDFGKEDLYSNLRKDLESKSNKFLYCTSLEEFLSNYGDKVAFIDRIFLENYFSDKYDYLLSLVNRDNGTVY